MKKLSVILVAAIMVLALTMPAAAFENEFGGFWRTRAYSNWNFTGEDKSKTLDSQRIDTRTRLFYTAKFSDNLKFVNKFEMNAVWGGQGTYGQLATDGANFVVKASYVDFKLGEQRFTVGAQDFTLARGYLLDDDGAGIKAIFKVNDAVYLPFIYMKINEGGMGKTATGINRDNQDIDAYVFYPSIFLSKDHVIKPHVAYLVSEDTRGWTDKSLTNAQLFPLGAAFGGATKLGLWTAGLEYDGKFDIFTVGATAIGEFGDMTVNPALNVNHHDKVNFKGYLFDLRGGVDLGPANIHVKGIYASGDGKNDVLRTGDYYGFAVPGVNNNVGGNINNFSQANWAEIMGCGMFDLQYPNGALGTQISNAIVGGVGASYKLIQDLQFSADVWTAYAADSKTWSVPTSITNARTQVVNSDYYGTELDLKVTYTIVDNLKIDLVGAYLWAGDIISKSTYATSSANPIEIGTQMSLAF